jgi:hypothetical protein
VAAGVGPCDQTGFNREKIFHSNEVLVTEDEEQFSVFIRILQEIGEEWSKPEEGSDVWLS